MAATPPVLPPPFLRGLEADLRALCAESRRQNPRVKEAAERVILLLKEADTPSASARAADEAAAAFCSACSAPDTSPTSSSARVVVRAVTGIHKLLTHRAVAPARLPALIDALELLASAAATADDVTLKVLQALLSLLTVRSYVITLGEAQLARAFSLLFNLRSGAKDGAADGVIEVTAQAAFRQVASDLFSTAADAITPAAAIGNSLAALPPVVQAAHALFQDMCAVIVGNDVSWLELGERSVSRVLALEVVDDGLAGNVGLFSASSSPAFSHLLSSRLCPGMHEMLRVEKERAVLKALFGLIVTVLRSFWRDIVPDTEALLSCLAKILAVSASPPDIPWKAVYAMEALRAILADASVTGRDPRIVSLFVAFDPKAAELASGGVMVNVIRAVCLASVACAASSHAALHELPTAPLRSSFKPFSLSSSNTYNMYVAAAAGICIAFAAAAKGAAEDGRADFSAIMTEETAKAVARQLACLLADAPAIAPASSKDDDNSSALEQIVVGLDNIAFAADKAGLEVTRAFVITALASSASSSLSRLVSTLPTSLKSSKAAAGSDEKRVHVLYHGLFALERTCGERFEASWRDFVNAVQPLDVALHGDTISPADSDSSINPASAASSPQSVTVANALLPLKTALEAAFHHAASLSWTASSDLVSALVASSRTSLASDSTKRALGSQAKSDAKISTSRSSGVVEIRIFGIVRTESVMLAIFGADVAGDDSDPKAMPHGLWQLITGHLIAIASDSPATSIRVTALHSLVRVASGALESRQTHLVSQDKILAPLTDLLSSTYVDSREGCLDAIYTLLETRGEFLKGSGAWSSIFTILRHASGASVVEKSSWSGSDGGHDGDEGETNGSGQGNDKGADSAQPGEAMVQLGFRAVQLIADDFLSFLAFETLSQWVVLLRMYCQQREDVNVALTAVGLIWRTADHFAKEGGDGREGREYDSLWMDLFEVLRAVGRDERPEVRNGAVKTLTSTLTAHGSILTAAAWKGCVERALLPLLEEVMHRGVSMLREPLPLGTRGKSEARLVLHHSRDTPRKQWNETRVLALGGVAAVLRKAMPKLASLSDEKGDPLLLMLTSGQADAIWAKMLRAAGSAASSTEKEVALAGVSALLELLYAAGSVVCEGDVGVVALWETVWSAIDESVYGSSGTLVPISNEKALVSLTKGIGRARKELETHFTAKSSVLLIRILAGLACGGTAREPAARDVAEMRLSLPTSGFTDIQKAAMTAIESLSFGDDAGTWIALVSQLLIIIRDREVRGKDVLMIRVVRLIETLFTADSLPSGVKATVLEEAISALGVVMHEQHLLTSRASAPLSRGVVSPASGNTQQHEERANATSPSTLSTAVSSEDSVALLECADDELWIISANAFTSVLLIGLKAGSPKVEFWSTLHRVASEFLYWRERAELDVVVVESRALEELALVEIYDIKLAQAMRDALGLMSGSISSEILRNLVGLLARGAQEGMQGGRPRFVRACQSCMFTLADKQWKSRTGGREDSIALRNDIAEQAAACVVLVSDAVLNRFVADGQRAGKCPLPAERRAEAVFLLKRLQALRLDDDGDGARRHLRTLHPRLCECVDKGGDDAVRLLAAAAIQAAA